MSVRSLNGLGNPVNVYINTNLSATTPVVVNQTDFSSPIVVSLNGLSGYGSSGQVIKTNGSALYYGTDDNGLWEASGDEIKPVDNAHNEVVVNGSTAKYKGTISTYDATYGADFRMAQYGCFENCATHTTTGYTFRVANFNPADAHQTDILCSATGDAVRLSDNRIEEYYDNNNNIEWLQDTSLVGNQRIFMFGSPLYNSTNTSYCFAMRNAANVINYPVFKNNGGSLEIEMRGNGNAFTIDKTSRKCSFPSGEISDGVYTYQLPDSNGTFMLEGGNSNWTYNGVTNVLSPVAVIQQVSISGYVEINDFFRIKYSDPYTTIYDPANGSEADKYFWKIHKNLTSQIFKVAEGDSTSANYKWYFGRNSATTNYEKMSLDADGLLTNTNGKLLITKPDATEGAYTECMVEIKGEGDSAGRDSIVKFSSHADSKTISWVYAPDTSGFVLNYNNGATDFSIMDYDIGNANIYFNYVDLFLRAAGSGVADENAKLHFGSFADSDAFSFQYNTTTDVLHLYKGTTNLWSYASSVSLFASAVSMPSLVLSNASNQLSNGTYEYTLPSKTDTLACLSDVTGDSVFTITNSNFDMTADPAQDGTNICKNFYISSGAESNGACTLYVMADTNNGGSETSHARLILSQDGAQVQGILETNQDNHIKLSNTYSGGAVKLEATGNNSKIILNCNSSSGQSVDVNSTTLSASDDFNCSNEQFKVTRSGATTYLQGSAGTFIDFHTNGSDLNIRNAVGSTTSNSYHTSIFNGTNLKCKFGGLSQENYGEYYCFNRGDTGYQIGFTTFMTNVSPISGSTKYSTLATDLGYLYISTKNTSIYDGNRSPSAPNNGTYTGYFDGTGWNGNSDASLKENVETITGALEKIKQMRGVYFNWIHDVDNKGRQGGFIAQEVNAIYPEACNFNEPTQLWSMDNGLVIDAILLEGIKEQQIEIDKLKTDNETLKADNEILKEEVSGLKEIMNKLVNAKSFAEFKKQIA